MAAESLAKIEVKFSDQAESNPITVYSSHTSMLSQGTAAPVGVNFTALPFAGDGQLNGLGCAGRITFYITSDVGAATLSTNCRWRIPITLRSQATGQVVTTMILTSDNMTGFTTGGAVTVTTTSGIPARLAYYDVPRGLVAYIASNQKVHAYIST